MNLTFVKFSIFRHSLNLVTQGFLIENEKYKEFKMISFKKKQIILMSLELLIFY